MIVDVDEINLDSPYPVYWGENRKSLIFSTKNRLRYKVTFTEDALLFKGLQVSYLSLSTPDRSQGVRHTPDPKVRETIFQILKNFLSRNHQVAVYICDSGDFLHKYRNRLFSSWFSQAEGLFAGQYVMHTVNYSAEDISFYGGIVCRQDNPLLEQYLEAFEQEKQLLEEK